MKKIIFSFKSLLLAAGLLLGSANSAWATETELAPVGVFTWTNTPEITYDGGATSWAINQGGVSGGNIGQYAGPYAIVKFDASSILAGKTLLTATLDFDITAGTYNNEIRIAQMSDATFTPSTVTTATFNKAATQFQSGDWSDKNSTKHFSYDVKARVEANNVLAFAIYGKNAREQTLKNVKLILNYSDVPVAKYSYSLKAVTAGDDEIETLESGEEYETNDVTLYFPYMFYKSTTLYTTATTPYGITVDKDHATKKVTYATASSNIVAYMEGESATANSGFDAAYSNGKNGYAAGNNTVTIKTLPAGKYTATIYLVSNGNRSIVIRDKDNTDVDNNVIATLPISKTSSAGTYTSDEFTLTEETTIGFSGYTSGTKTNQSADIDYIYIQKTADVLTSSANLQGYKTFYNAGSNYQVDENTTIYKGSATKETVTLTSVDGNIIPKNTPVVLKTTNTTDYTIALTATETASSGDFTGNALQVADGGETGVYILAYTTAYGFGFYNFTGDLVAGDVYLAIPSSGVKMFNVVVDGTATGVEAPVAAEAEEEEILYNTAGVRVDKNYKGIVINQKGEKRFQK